jgi:hypothetical protein
MRLRTANNNRRRRLSRRRYRFVYRAPIPANARILSFEAHFVVDGERRTVTKYRREGTTLEVEVAGRPRGR